MSLHVFFDTEFTQFRDSELLSIGLVTEDDKQFYLEVMDKRRHARSSEFCQAIVLSQFGAIAGAAANTDREVGNRLADWLLELPAPGFVLVSDYSGDRLHFENVLRIAGRREQVLARMQHLDVADIEPLEGHDGARIQDEFFERLDRPLPELMRHHALLDAYALRERWRAALRASSA